MKSVLISTQPNWCQKICHNIGERRDGTLIYEKEVEIRKTMPKLQTPFKCYIYCTYGEGLIEYSDECMPNMLIGQKVTKDNIWSNCCNGKIIGEFICDKMFPIRVFENGTIQDYMFYNMERSCVPYDDIVAYIGKGKTGYGWGISDLVIYDKPKELSEFEVECKGGCDFPYVYEPPCKNCGKNKLKRAPQSWCFVQEIYNGKE